jgi:hypothetical protein
MILCDNLRAKACLNFSKFLPFWLEGLKISVFFSEPHPIEILIHALFNVPNHQAAIIHARVIIARRKKSRVDWIPSEGVAVTRVLDHATGDENLLNLARSDAVSLS